MVGVRHILECERLVAFAADIDLPGQAAGLVGDVVGAAEAAVLGGDQVRRAGGAGHPGVHLEVHRVGRQDALARGGIRHLRAEAVVAVLKRPDAELVGAVGDRVVFRERVAGEIEVVVGVDDAGECGIVIVAAVVGGFTAIARTASR